MDSDVLLKSAEPISQSLPSYEDATGPPHHQTVQHFSPSMVPQESQPSMVLQQPFPSMVSSYNQPPIMSQPTVVNYSFCGDNSNQIQVVGQKKMTTICKSCHSNVRTKTSTTHKCKTHLCCCLLCFTGIFCPLIFLPYCCCSPEKVEHWCPKCNGLIGTYYG